MSCVQSRIASALSHYGDQNRSMIDVLGLGQEPFWDDRVKDFYGWYSKSASKTDKDAWTWEGQDTRKWSTTRGASKRNQSVPANPADRTNPEEKAFPWRDIGDLNTDLSYLYPGSPQMKSVQFQSERLPQQGESTGLHAVDREDS